MAENLIIAEGGKAEKYALLYKQIEALVEGESDTIANMANIAAMIHHTFSFWWTGFYRVCGQVLAKSCAATCEVMVSFDRTSAWLVMS